MAKRRLLTAVAPVLALMATAAAAQDVYKWVDEQGRMHFSSTPPVGKRAAKLEIQPTPAEPVGPSRARTWQEQLQQSNERREQAQKAELETASQQKEGEQRCLAAQRNLDVLRKERPVYRVNGQGDREYLEDSQRAAAMEAAQQRVALHCRN